MDAAAISSAIADDARAGQGRHRPQGQPLRRSRSHRRRGSGGDSPVLPRTRPAGPLETSGELQSLEMWLQEIQSKRPLTPREKLETALNEAVRNENYEEAARVRDALRRMG